MDIAAFRYRFDAGVSGVALPFNMELMYLILKRGSQHLRDYKWVLLAICISDISMNLVVFVSHPVIIFKSRSCPSRAFASCIAAVEFVKIGFKQLKTLA